MRTKSPAGAADALPPPSKVHRVAWMLGLGLWMFLFLALVSFDSADAPSHVVAVHNDPPANWCGLVGATLTYWAYHVMGIGSWVIPIGLAILLGVTVTGRRVTHPLLRSMGLLLMATAVSGLHGVIAPNAGPLSGSEPGLLAQRVVAELIPRFSGMGTIVLLLIALGVGAVVAMDQIVFALPRWTLIAFGLPRHMSLSRVIPFHHRWQADPIAVGATPVSRAMRWLRRGRPIDPDAGGLGATEPFDPDDHLLNAEADSEALSRARPDRPRLTAEQLREKIAKLPVRMSGSPAVVARDEDIPREENFEGYRYPTLELLSDPESNYSQKMEAFVRRQAEQLEESLHTYGIDGEVVRIESGPVVTLFSVQLAPGTKVAKVTTIASDLARSLRAQNVRIVANMAGKTTVGIEVPNLRKERVRLKELMSGGQAEGMLLPMFLGKDVAGEPLVADLTAMPHMLIAGTTGSGKSVCINTIVMSWLYTKRPDELKLVLVDPKMVELSQFAEIPHLMCPVVTEANKAVAILEWAVNKMEERYELLHEAMVRDVASFNALSEQEKTELFKPKNDEELARIPKKLPFMVFIVDELADLILTTTEAEHWIVRIAQKARAVGIHLILATQRPQANVVTGLIKSNMPCRVSFKVASGMDSRIVLDQKGAEVLLGQGDMLFLTPHTSEVKRAQGTLVTDVEIRRVANFLKSVASPAFERSLMNLRPGGSVDGEAVSPNERDPLFDEAVEVMIETGRGSVSLLQRRLAIGYSRASRLVDQMALAGILGDHKGSVAREVLITLEEWEQMKAMEEAAGRDGALDQTEGPADRKPGDKEESPEVETVSQIRKSLSPR